MKNCLKQTMICWNDFYRLLTSNIWHVIIITSPSYVDCIVSGVISQKPGYLQRHVAPSAERQSTISTKQSKIADFDFLWKPLSNLTSFQGKVISNWSGGKILYCHIQLDSVEYCDTDPLYSSHPWGPVGSHHAVRVCPLALHDGCFLPSGHEQENDP